MAIEKDWIQHNLLNANLPPYMSGIRKTIESQICNDDDIDDVNGNQLRPSVKFDVSTIKNGTISHSVNDISLDCDTVRVSVMLTLTDNGANEQVDYFDQICFDGKSTVLKVCKHNYKCKRKCYNWTKKNKDDKNAGIMIYRDNVLDSKTSVIVHGPADDDDDPRNLVFYADFSLKSLRDRFGSGLTNGITPRVRGYTKNKNKFYCCGGFDYLIYGKSKQVVQNRVCCDMTKNENENENDSASESPSSQSNGWLNVAREAENDTKALYDWVFNKETTKSSLRVQQM